MTRKEVKICCISRMERNEFKEVGRMIQIKLLKIDDIKFPQGMEIELNYDYEDEIWVARTADYTGTSETLEYAILNLLSIMEGAE